MYQDYQRQKPQEHGNMQTIIILGGASGSAPQTGLDPRFQVT